MKSGGTRRDNVTGPSRAALHPPRPLAFPLGVLVLYAHLGQRWPPTGLLPPPAQGNKRGFELASLVSAAGYLIQASSCWTSNPSLMLLQYQLGYNLMQVRGGARSHCCSVQT